MPRRRTGVRAQTIADKVHTLLGREIAAGVYRPGERIHEKALAQRLGISRTPIREALLRLQAEGVVTCTSRRSYNVRVLTADDVREIYETLGLLEGAAASAVAHKLETRDFDELERLNELMVGAAAAADLPAFGRFNRQFHHVFLDKVDNTVLRETCDHVRGPLYTFPVQPGSLAAWLGKSVEEHKDIIRLARARDAEALGAYFRDVHWSYRLNERYITEAFDVEGEAAVHL